MKVTIKQVAKEAGVTPSVVSRIINNDESLSVRDSTRERVISVIEKLNYKPNAIARSLRVKHTKTIAMLIPDIANQFWPEVIKGAQLSASEQGYSLFLCSTDEDPDKELEYIELAVQKQTDGLLIASIYIEDKTIDIVNQHRIPFVLINRNTKDAKHSFVGADDFKGTCLAMEHLIEKGHKKIAIIAGLLYTDTGLERLRGYRMSLNRAGISIPPEYIVEAGFEESNGYEAMKKLISLSDRPTAVFASNDSLAVGALAAAAESGIRVPDDISIISFNDTWIAKRMTPPLTSVHVSLKNMGYFAAELLIKKINGEEPEKDKIILSPELVIRKSVKEIK